METDIFLIEICVEDLRIWENSENDPCCKPKEPLKSCLQFEFLSKVMLSICARKFGCPQSTEAHCKNCIFVLNKEISEQDKIIIRAYQIFEPKKPLLVGNGEIDVKAIFDSITEEAKLEPPVQNNIMSQLDSSSSIKLRGQYQNSIHSLHSLYRSQVNLVTNKSGSDLLLPQDRKKAGRSSSTKKFPLTAIRKGLYPLFNTEHNEKQIGIACVLIRLSCYGPVIMPPISHDCAPDVDDNICGSKTNQYNCPVSGTRNILSKQGRYQEFATQINNNALVVRVNKNSNLQKEICNQNSDQKYTTENFPIKCPFLRDMMLGPQQGQLTKHQCRRSFGGNFHNNCQLPPIKGNFKYPGTLKCIERNLTTAYPEKPKRNFSHQCTDEDINLGSAGIPGNIEVIKKDTCDPKNEIFVVRVGKKKGSLDKQYDIELEMTTPRRNSEDQLTKINQVGYAQTVEEEFPGNERAVVAEATAGEVVGTKTKGKKGKGKGKGKSKKK